MLAKFWIFISINSINNIRTFLLTQWYQSNSTFSKYLTASFTFMTDVIKLATTKWYQTARITAKNTHWEATANLIWSGLSCGASKFVVKLTLWAMGLGLYWCLLTLNNWISLELLSLLFILKFQFFVSHHFNLLKFML